MPQAFSSDDTKDVLRGIVMIMLMFSVAAAVPLLGSVLTLFIPLPVLFYRSKLGRSKSLVVPLVAMVLMMLVFRQTATDLWLLAELLLLGFVLGELLETGLGIEKIVAGACGAVLVTGALGLLAWAVMSGTSAFSLVSRYVLQNLEMQVKLFQKMGLSTEDARLFTESLPAIQAAVIRYIPGLLSMGLLFLSWISLLMARPLFKRRGLYFPDFGSLAQWKAPEVLVWGVIICGMMLLIPSVGFKAVGLNGLMILLTVFFFEGIAIVAFFFEKKKFPSVLRVFLYSLILLQQVVLLLVVGLGFFDVWLNFRKLGTEKTK